MKLVIKPAPGCEGHRFLTGRQLAVELNGVDISGSVDRIELVADVNEVVRARLDIHPGHVEVDARVIVALAASATVKPADQEA